MKKAFVIVIILLIALAYLFNRAEHKESVTYAELDFTPPPEVKERPVKAKMEESVSFADRAQAVLEKLPTDQTFEKMNSQELHYVPKQIMNGGEQIGLLLDAAEKDTSLRATTIDFLFACARREAIVEQLRALCLSHLNDYQVKGFVKHLDASEFPDHVVALAENRPLKKWAEQVKNQK